jgi:hypothetical protein
MPNWCDNYVEIKGPKKVLDEIEDIVKEENNDKERKHGLLNHLRPMPKEEKDNWYQWSIDNWGTKWDITEFYGTKRDGDKLCFSFQSAWGPPEEAFDYFYDNNDDVSINLKYYEPGMDFAGIYNDGDSDSYTLSEAAPKGPKDEFWQTEDGKALDDTFEIVQQMIDFGDNE